MAKIWLQELLSSLKWVSKLQVLVLGLKYGHENCYLIVEGPQVLVTWS